MKIYTKTGDTGTTALFGGTRVPKDHIRIESYGTVDELNSHIGLIRDQEFNAHYKNILIEIQDRLFTVGAILAITSDPFLVFSSNIFAILGLRSMYFFLANMIEKFSYIEYSLIAILTFVGVKMLLIHHFPEYFPEWLSLAFIALSITTGVLVSLQKNKNQTKTN